MARVAKLDPAEQLFHWIRTRQAGCSYAALLANRDEAKSWRSWTTELPKDEASVENIEKVLQLAVGETAVHAVVIVFRDIETPTHLAILANRLCEHDSWSCCEPRQLQPSLGGVRRFSLGLRWTMPNTHTSYVLGFGPFGFFPPTRRAPYCALTVPTCEVGPLRDPSLTSVERHLCDMRNERFDSNKWKRLWKSTTDLKQALVNDSDETSAKAKVTFVLPEEIREQVTALTQ